MNKRYAVYCSGGAGRVLKFYQEVSLSNYPVEFVFYDGRREDVADNLYTQFGKKLINYKDDENPSNTLLEFLNLKNVDYLFCFGDRILRNPLIENYKNRIINFHPSLLPAFPGLNAIDQALESGVQVLGNTAHFIDEGVDTGPIIMQSVISRALFNAYDDVLDLQLLMLRKIWMLLDNQQIQVVSNRVAIQTCVNENVFFSI